MRIYEEYKWTYVKFGENEVPNFYGILELPYFWDTDWLNWRMGEFDRIITGWTLTIMRELKIYGYDK